MIDNIISTILLTLLCLYFFRHRQLSTKNLFLFAIFCLPFAEVLTFKLGIRFIITDWLSIFIFLKLITRESSKFKYLKFYQILSILIAAFLAIWSTITILNVILGLNDILSASGEFGRDRVLAGELKSPIAIALVENLRLLQGMALIGITVAMSQTHQTWLEISDILIKSATLNSIYGLYQISRFFLGFSWLPLLPNTYERHFIVTEGYGRATGFMWEPTVFGSFTALICILVLWRLGRKFSLINSLVIIINLLALLFSFSATGFIAFIVGFTVLLLTSRFRAINIPIIAICSLAIVCLLFSSGEISEIVSDMFQYKVFTPDGGYSNISRVQREENIEFYINEIIPEFGLTGIGVGQTFFLTGDTVGYPIKIFTELGIIGITAFTLLLFSVWLHIWKQRYISDTNSWAFVVAILCAIVVIIAIQGKSKINFIWFFIGYILALNNQKSIVNSK